MGNTTTTQEIITSHKTQEILTSNVQDKLELLSISKPPALKTRVTPQVATIRQNGSKKYASKKKQKMKMKAQKDGKRAKKSKDKKKSNVKRSMMKDITNTGMFAMENFSH